MNWNAVEGNWKLIKGKAKVKWARMTGDPFSVIAGRQEQMTERIQKKYASCPKVDGLPHWALNP